MSRPAKEDACAARAGCVARLNAPGASPAVPGRPLPLTGCGRSSAGISLAAAESRLSAAERTCLGRSVTRRVQQFAMGPWEHARGTSDHKINDLAQRIAGFSVAIGYSRSTRRSGGTPFEKAARHHDGPCTAVLDHVLGGVDVDELPAGATKPPQLLGHVHPLLADRAVGIRHDQDRRHIGVARRQIAGSRASGIGTSVRRTSDWVCAYRLPHLAAAMWPRVG